MTPSAPRPTGDDVLKLVEEAAAVEREACARIADDIARHWVGHYGPAPAQADIAGQIAAQIRARSNPK